MDTYGQGFWCGSVIKNLPAMQKMQETPQVRSLSQEDPLEEGLATHSSILALENPIERGAWHTPVHRVAQGQTRLKWLSVYPCHTWTGLISSFCAPSPTTSSPKGQPLNPHPIAKDGTSNEAEAPLWALIFLGLLAPGHA